MRWMQFPFQKSYAVLPCTVFHGERSTSAGANGCQTGKSQACMAGEPKPNQVAAFEVVCNRHCNMKRRVVIMKLNVWLQIPVIFGKLVLKFDKVLSIAFPISSSSSTARHALLISPETEHQPRVVHEIRTKELLFQAACGSICAASSPKPLE